MAEQGTGPNPQMLMAVSSAADSPWFTYRQTTSTDTADSFEAGDYT